MTEKRFIPIFDGTDKRVVGAKDNGKIISFMDMFDLLNDLTEENEQLKIKLEDIALDMENAKESNDDAQYELYKIKKENEKLKKGMIEVVDRYIYASIGVGYEILDSWFGYTGDGEPTEREIEEYDYLVIGLASNQDAAEGICRRLNDQQDEINHLSNFGLHVILDKKNKEIEELKRQLDNVDDCLTRDDMVMLRAERGFE